GIKQMIISDRLNIPHSTVYDTIKRYKETGSAEPKECSDHPKMLTKRDNQ
ncbi:3778_t:CDS:1, partial [Funneliformis geosporum]